MVGRKLKSLFMYRIGKKNDNMSSFIVSDKTLQNVVSWVVDNSNEYRGSIIDSLVIDLLKKFNLDFEHEDFPHYLVNSFLYLNKLGTDSRYEESNVVAKIRFCHVEVSDVQALKSAECLRYQSSEGKVPELKAYKFLTELIDLLRIVVIEKLDEYKKASWDA